MSKFQDAVEKYTQNVFVDSHVGGGKDNEMVDSNMIEECDSSSVKTVSKNSHVRKIKI